MAIQSSGTKQGRAGVILGVGFGGLFDSFVFHMILQWHHMLSNVIPADSMGNMHRLMFFDGLFDAFNFGMLLVGSILLWKGAYYRLSIPSFVPFMGQLLFGAGLFNLVEAVTDHHILAIHYVRQVPDPSVYNFTFLAVGALLPLIVGGLMMRSGRWTVRGL